MTTFTDTKVMTMYKILLAIALIAGYTYISNQDFEDQQLAHQWNSKKQ
jgi:hypothetical protein